MLSSNSDAMSAFAAQLRRLASLFPNGLEGIDTDRPLTLLRGVARLSADLGMSVVVEGIETNEQLELISADGTVTEAQGYLFSRPVPAVRVRQLLNASHARRMRVVPYTNSVTRRRSRSFHEVTFFDVIPSGKFLKDTSLILTEPEKKDLAALATRLIRLRDGRICAGGLR